jgi:hypothetical protein
MVDPTRVRDKELRCAWCDPVWQAVVVLLCRLNLPAHDQEHDEDYGYLLRLAANVRKCPQNVGKELRQRMRLYAALGVHKGGEVWVQRAHERFDGQSLCGAVLAVLQKLEHDYVKGTGWLDIAWQCEVSRHIGSILGKGVAANIARLGLLWRRQIGVDRPA